MTVTGWQGLWGTSVVNPWLREAHQTFKNPFRHHSLVIRKRSMLVHTFFIGLWAKIARNFILCPYSSAWDFIAHAHKTGSWYPISTANELFRHIPVMVVRAKFGADWLNHVKVIQLLVKFVMSSAAIFDFEKMQFLSVTCMRCTEIKLLLKFHENRTEDSKVIQVFVIF